MEDEFEAQAANLIGWRLAKIKHDSKRLVCDFHLHIIRNFCSEQYAHSIGFAC